ncbi:MAG: protein phosphatase 2C domain-containing protein [Spirochaetaceae bacterium]|jgi:hypothetical protein|nr:protein phosphatase 2C domain-containing protein [Spirochaetaceae bacterium]
MRKDKSRKSSAERQDNALTPFTPDESISEKSIDLKSVEISDKDKSTSVTEKHSHAESDKRENIPEISLKESKDDVMKSAEPEKKTNGVPKRNLGAWQSIGESVVGMAHRRGIIPVACQDAYCINTTKRTILVVCDGAGSAVMSEIGSQNVSQSVVRFIFSLKHIMVTILDRVELNFPINEILISKMIYRHSIQTIKDLSLNYKRESKDFRTTTNRRYRIFN